MTERILSLIAILAVILIMGWRCAEVEKPPDPILLELQIQTEIMERWALPESLKSAEMVEPELIGESHGDSHSQD